MQCVQLAMNVVSNAQCMYYCSRTHNLSKCFVWSPKNKSNNSRAGKHVFLHTTLQPQLLALSDPVCNFQQPHSSEAVQMKSPIFKMCFEPCFHFLFLLNDNTERRKQINKHFHAKKGTMHVWLT